MPYRTTALVTGEYYHIYNRGVDKMLVYRTTGDYKRFLKSSNYYRLLGPKPRFSLFKSGTIQQIDWNNKIVEIVCFCLMPNHFHLLVKQVKDGGVTDFIRKQLDSYTKYFNIKHNRVGPLFQGEFKSVLIESNEQLLHVSRYIHLNPLVSGIITELEDYVWSSYLEYLGLSDSNFCNKEIILDQFKTKENYKKFVLDQAAYGMELELIKHQLIDVNS